jgi:hypothetical protein
MAVLLAACAIAACGGETDGSVHLPSAGDPNDPHFKQTGDPITFVHVVDNGSEVVVTVNLGPGDGSRVAVPEGWRFVAFIGEASKDVVGGKATFGADSIGKTDPVRVELHRAGRAVTVFEVAAPPVFEAPNVPATSVTIGSKLAVEITPIAGLSADAFECGPGAECTFVMLIADAACLSWDSSVHFFEPLESLSRSRVVELPIIESEFVAGPCGGKIVQTVARTKEWSDGNMYFGRERGPDVTFVR